MTDVIEQIETHVDNTAYNASIMCEHDSRINFMYGARLAASMILPMLKVALSQRDDAYISELPESLAKRSIEKLNSELLKLLGDK